MVEKQEKKSRKKKPKTRVTRGKRKRAVARATIKEGTGIVRVNNELLQAVNQPLFRELVAEPLQFVGEKNYDISVNVHGGGVMGQAQAARIAVARALVEFTGDKTLKSKMVSFDRSLLVEDPRRVEPKKFKGPKARARFTKSYR